MNSLVDQIDNPRFSQVGCTAVLRALAVAFICTVGLSIGSTSLQAGATTTPSQSWSVVYSPSVSVSDALEGISCVAANSCVAVGYSHPSVAPQVIETLIESWNGTSWNVVPSPNPSSISALNAVSCVAANSCIAVGYAYNGATQQTLVESWNGASWSVVPSPNSSTNTNVLSGVSCSAAGACTAVGHTYGGGVTAYETLVELWNGSTWSISTSPNPGTQGNVLSGVSCPNSSTCVAVGYQQGGTGDSLAELWNGTTWLVTPSPSSPAGGGVLNAVSCTSTSSCVAAGGGNQTLVESWNGTTWSIVSIPTMSQVNYLSGVSCTSATSCVAVGVGNLIMGNANPYVPTTTRALVESWNGATWSVTPSPSPSTSAYLLAVSCATASSCTAAGGSATSENGNATLVEVGSPDGYWLVGDDGGIFTFGSATFHGSTGNLQLQRPVVGITPTSDDGGYWLAAADGGAFAFGDAGYYGSIPGLGIAPADTTGAGKHLNAPIVGMVPSADGAGYFMVGGDGGVFAFGDANYEGSCPGIGGCDAPAVAVMPDATGKGYWLVTKVGSVYAFGDAPSLGGTSPQSVPVTGAVRTPDGEGYWILFGNGVVANFGDAISYGTILGQVNALDPAEAIFGTADGKGYWIATAQGAVYPFGDAVGLGGMANTHLNKPIIAATGG